MNEFSPDMQAALDELKAYVRNVASSETIDLAALLLTGLPTEDEIDAGVLKIAREMVEHLARRGNASHVAHSLGYAFAEVVRQRVVELEMTGRGRA